jgi:solute carrier family 8 (sodium/calcium exchanger)
VITAFFSIFAYFWLYYVLVVHSPDAVEIWEGLVTLIMFPILIILGYMADKGYFSAKTDDDSMAKTSYEGLTPEEVDKYIDSLRQRYGKDLPDSKLMRILEMELAPKKTYANYRSGMSKGMTGRKPPKGDKGSEYETSPSNTPGEKGDAPADLEAGATNGSGKKNDQNNGSPTRPNPLDNDCVDGIDSNTGERCVKKSQVFWDVGGNNFVALECVGTIEVPVKVLPSNRVTRVHYETREGTAKEVTEYTGTSGSLEFPPSTKEQTQFVKVDIIDDEEFEDEMEFYIDLSTEDTDNVEIFGPTCTVTVIDDDDPGTLAFKDETINVPATAAEVDVAIIRRKGASGQVGCTIKSEEHTAKDGLDFEPIEELVVEMESNEVDAGLKLSFPPLPEGRKRVGKEFRVVMSDATGGAIFNKDTDGGKDTCICTIVFVSDEEHLEFIRHAHETVVTHLELQQGGGTSWGEQFT